MQPITSTTDRTDDLSMARVRAALVILDDFGPAGDVESDPATWGPETDAHVWEPTDPALDADGRLDVAAIAEADYEPTAEDWAEADRVHNAMASERLLGVDLHPTAEDQQWWASATRHAPEPLMAYQVPASDDWHGMERRQGCGS